MSEEVVLNITGIVVFGVTAQWLASRLGLPSILLLLTCGIVTGPVLGWIRPEVLFRGHDDFLFAIVSIAVALILYEGGLSLKLSELPKVGSVIRNLISIGALLTWVVTLLAARIIFGLDTRLAALLGAVLVVTGPTVIGPLLRQIRPSGAVGSILKWEGITIDPIGALSAVLIFEVITIGGPAREVGAVMAGGALKTLVFGGGIGLVAAGLLVLLLERYWIADHLQSAVSLMLVCAAFAASNHFQPESGLLATTIMGVALANQKRVDVKHIAEFKENLRVLLISSLFIVLGARLELSAFSGTLVRGLVFVAVLVGVARPLAVLVSSWGSNLSIRERVFLAWMAPRGIVAAAVASVFAIRLERIPGLTGADLLVPITFITIIATVAIYGLTSAILARRLGVAEANPQGILFVGAHAWARDLAAVLQGRGCRVLLVDNNRDHISAARMAGLPAHAGSILAEQVLDEIDLGGLGRILAVTPNDWVNVLAVRRFAAVFGRAHCYQLAPHDEKPEGRRRHRYLHGRWLFHERMTHEALRDRRLRGFVVKATGLTAEFDYAAYRQRYGPSAVPLLVADEKSRLKLVSADGEITPQAGETLIGLVKDEA